jgi:cytosine/adenosine deaminase-related metal-dependent hydrolase
MRFLSATYLFDGKQYLDSDLVLVLGGESRLLNIVNRKDVDAGNIEHYDGIICPGFVNAHCHLELSYLKSEIEPKKGMLEFAKGIIGKRMLFSDQKINDAAVQADKEMWNNGIVAVGDISNVRNSFEIKKNSKLFYHTFIELIGLNPMHSEVVFNFGKDTLNGLHALNLKGSLTPHAPYSVSGNLMERIALENKTLPTSIHNQESEAENDFFREKKGDFTELYQFLKAPIEYFTSTEKSSIQSYLPHLKNTTNLLLIHNTFSNDEDVKWANGFHDKLYWCLCPNANLYIENRLPDIHLLINNDCRICLGTDSLASNHSLSVLDEMNVLLDKFPGLKPEQVLGWATFNGAEALMIEDNFGGFIKNKNAGLNLLNFKNNKLNLVQKLA